MRGGSGSGGLSTALSWSETSLCACVFSFSSASFVAAAGALTTDGEISRTAAFDCSDVSEGAAALGDTALSAESDCSSLTDSEQKISH